MLTVHTIIAVIVALAVAVSVPPVRGCESNQYACHGDCYKVYKANEDYESRSSFVSRCKSGHGMLAVVRNVHDQSCLETALQGRSGKYCIGLYRVSGTVYEWDDGTSVTYTNWQDGEPSYWENCVVLGSSSSFKWQSHACDDEGEIGFICKYEGPPSSSTTLSTTTILSSTESVVTTTLQTSGPQSTTTLLSTSNHTGSESEQTTVVTSSSIPSGVSMTSSSALRAPQTMLYPSPGTQSEISPSRESEEYSKEGSLFGRELHRELPSLTFACVLMAMLSVVIVIDLYVSLRSHQ